MTDTSTDHQVADNVFAFTGTSVNWVILQEGTELTLVDAGWEGDTQEVERSIRSIGRRPEDLRAVLLTHAHADHTGALDHLHDTYGTPIYMASAEVPNATGEDVESAGPADVAKLMYRPQAVRWAAQLVKAGGLQHTTTPAARPFPESGPLDLPGRPVPVATPGHTSGHTSYLVPSIGGVISGDALVSAHPTLKGVGPRLLPSGFTHDQSQAVGSLRVLGDLDAEVFVPGHGPAWYGSLRSAVQEALSHVHARDLPPEG